MLGLGLVHDVDVVEHGVHGLNSGHGHIEFGGQLDRGSQEGLDFHRPSDLKVLVHGAGRIRCSHLLDRLLSEVTWELAALGCGQLQELVHDAVHQLADADFLKELGRIGGIEDYACGMERDRSMQALATGLRRGGYSQKKKKEKEKNSPNHSLKLLLSNILRHLAIDLARAECHG